MRAVRTKIIPTNAPLVSIKTSRTLAPLPATKSWCISSLDAYKTEKAREIKNINFFFSVMQAVKAATNNPKPANSVK